MSEFIFGMLVHYYFEAFFAQCLVFEPIKRVLKKKMCEKYRFASGYT